MMAPLIFMVGIVALIAGVLAWAMALRYGRWRALVVPVLAVVAAIASAMRGADFEETTSLERVALAMAFAGPAVAGALVGLVLARTRGR